MILVRVLNLKFLYGLAMRNDRNFKFTALVGPMLHAPGFSLVRGCRE